MKKHYLMLTFTLDIPKMCDYQRKQFLKHVDKKVKDAMKQHAEGKFIETCIDLNYTQGRVQ